MWSFSFFRLKKINHHLCRTVGGSCHCGDHLLLVGSMCDRIVVMLEGGIVETGPSMEVLNTPSNAYTRLLIRSALTLDMVMAVKKNLVKKRNNYGSLWTTARLYSNH